MTKDSLHTACVICGSSNLSPLPKYQEVKLCKCNNCDLVFSQRKIGNDELTEFYTNLYQRTNYFSPITAKRYEELLDTFEPFRKTNKILDVGCGCGFFLEVAKEKGWEVYGTEFADNVVEECSLKGFNMQLGSLENVQFENDMFDIIVSIEVIEHLIDPKATVSEMYRIVRPGGCVYITTPNFNSLLRYKMGPKYDVIRFPLHLIYFTPKTLQGLFSQIGFTSKNVFTSGYSRTRIRTSKGQSNQEYVSETSDDEMFRYRIEKRWYMRTARDLVNASLNLFKVGDSIKATFIKK